MSRYEEMPRRGVAHRLVNQLRNIEPDERLGWAGIGIAGSTGLVAAIILIDWALQKILWLVTSLGWLGGLLFGGS